MALNNHSMSNSYYSWNVSGKNHWTLTLEPGLLPDLVPDRFPRLAGRLPPRLNMERLIDAIDATTFFCRFLTAWWAVIGHIRLLSDIYQIIQADNEQHGHYLTSTTMGAGRLQVFQLLGVRQKLIFKKNIL